MSKMTRKSAAERQRTARWEKIVSDYQRRHRQWVMTSMPQMGPAHWKLYEHWVAGFGALCLDQASRNSRKMRRRLRAARVTAPVTRQDMFLPEPSHLSDAWNYMALKHSKMRFAMALTAPEVGGAKTGRATRRR